MIEQLQGKNIVVYDCEIKREIDMKNITWNDHDKMGLSVAVLFDYMDMDYKVYFEKDLQKLCHRLNESELVVAFNQKGFDEKLLRALGGDLKEAIPNYDMLEESRKATGWCEGKRFPSGLKLDNHLEAIFGKDQMKTEHGSQAPVMWQKGLHAEVITYCLADVKRERMLFEHIWEKGWVETAVHGVKEISTAAIKQVVEG